MLRPSATMNQSIDLLIHWFKWKKIVSWLNIVASIILQRILGR